jgi:hypothetical protein
LHAYTECEEGWEFVLPGIVPTEYAIQAIRRVVPQVVEKKVQKTGGRVKMICTIRKPKGGITKPPPRNRQQPDRLDQTTAK